MPHCPWPSLGRGQSSEYFTDDRTASGNVGSSHLPISDVPQRHTATRLTSWGDHHQERGLRPRGALGRRVHKAGTRWVRGGGQAPRSGSPVKSPHSLTRIAERGLPHAHSLTRGPHHTQAPRHGTSLKAVVYFSAGWAPHRGVPSLTSHWHSFLALPPPSDPLPSFTRR